MSALGVHPLSRGALIAAARRSSERDRGLLHHLPQAIQPGNHRGVKEQARVRKELLGLGRHGRCDHVHVRLRLLQAITAKLGMATQGLLPFGSERLGVGLGLLVRVLSTRLVDRHEEVDELLRAVLVETTGVVRLDLRQNGREGVEVFVLDLVSIREGERLVAERRVAGLLRGIRLRFLPRLSISRGLLAGIAPGKVENGRARSRLRRCAVSGRRGRIRRRRLGTRCGCVLRHTGASPGSGRGTARGS